MPVPVPVPERKWRLVAILCAACSPDASTSTGGQLDDAGTTATGSTGQTSANPTGTSTPTETGPPADCSDAMLCTPIGPPAWSLVAVDTYPADDPVRPCPPGWTTQTEAFEITEPPASCACSCTGPTGTCEVDATFYGTDDTCSTLVGSQTLGDGDCWLFAAVTGTTVYLEAGPPVLTDPQCAPTLTETIPELLVDRATICTPPLGAACDGGVCSTAPPPDFAGTTCLMRDGDQPCPAGPYADKSLLFASYSDTRACPTCGCDLAMPACTGELTTHSGVACPGAGDPVVTDGNCNTAMITDNLLSIRFANPVPQGTCSPPDPTPPVDGEVTLNGPVTICC